MTTVPCASGWCGKVIEGETGAFREDGELTLTALTSKNFDISIAFLAVDFDMATQRMCVQRGPDDSQDRCANTIYNYKKVFMCFCQGDLCNKSSVIHRDASKMLLFSFIALYSFNYLLIKTK